MPGGFSSEDNHFRVYTSSFGYNKWLGMTPIFFKAITSHFVSFLYLRVFNSVVLKVQAPDQQHHLGTY